MEVRNLAERATTPSKGFCFVLTTTHVDIHCICGKYVCSLCCSNVFPLEVKNKPSDGGTKHVSILGLLAWLQTEALSGRGLFR
jgi:hypothetical protein